MAHFVIANTGSVKCLEELFSDISLVPSFLMDAGIIMVQKGTVVIEIATVGVSDLTNQVFYLFHTLIPTVFIPQHFN